MNNLLKTLALMLALVMALCVFTACKDKNGDNSGDNLNTEVTTPENIGLYDAEGNKLLGADDTFMTINGIEVPLDVYRYWYKMLDNYYFSAGDSAYWTENASAHESLLEYTEHYVLQNYLGYLLADKYDISLTEEDKQTIADYLAEEVTYYESEEAYYKALEESGLTEKLLEKVITNDIMSNRVYEDLYANEDAIRMPSDEDAKALLNKDYVRVYHVLISYEHFKGLEGHESDTEEELKAAALSLANDILVKLQNGEADIYELAQELGDDPGMVENVDGYLFTYGEMVEPFEKASFELEVGGLSGLVETSYGWHIIQRLEQEQWIEDNWDKARETVISAISNEDVNEALENAEIVYNEYYESMTAGSLK